MLKVKNLTFGYDKKNSEACVLKNINFELKEGENMAIIGESGSGKSTLLKLIYGEFDLDKGEIFWKDTRILGPKFNLVVGYDFMKYVAQEFDLMPFITVEENIGKYLSNFFPEEKKERVRELLEVVELKKLSKTKVKNLSGGQKQRVALARALARQPEILLLDEPFSHIDNFKKQSLRRNVFKFLKDKNIACIVATHDHNDVLGYADRMLVLHDAKVLAISSPQQLYKNPQNKLIASFFGEFNELSDIGIVFAHQLKVVEDSDMQVITKHYYFKGNHYLVEAQFEDKTIWFEHDTAIEKNTTVHLKILK